jgi:hypothetical protein
MRAVRIVVAEHFRIKRGFDNVLPARREACRLRRARLKTAAYSRKEASSSLPTNNRA